MEPERSWSPHPRPRAGLSRSGVSASLQGGRKQEALGTQEGGKVSHVGGVWARDRRLHRWG